MASQSALDELERCEKLALNSVTPDRSYYEIVSLNIHSLPAHIEDVKRFVNRTRPTVICIQETWLPNSLEDSSMYEIDGYDLFLNSIGRGRGIATYCLTGFFNFVKDISKKDIQMTKVMNDEFSIINVYRSAECQDFEIHLSSLVKSSKDTIVCGDVNIDLRRDGQKQSKLLQYTESIGFNQCITQSTHEKGGLLDHVYVSKDFSSNIVIEKKSIRFSDHDMIYIRIKK